MKLPRIVTSLGSAFLGLTLACSALASSNDPQEETASPFKVEPLVKIQGNERTLEIQFSCPPEHHLYADELSFELNGAAINVTLPKPVEIPDRFGDGVKATFANTFSANYPLAQTAEPLELVVNLRGCNHDECYFPESRNFKITGDNHVVAITDADATETIASTTRDPKELLADFNVVKRASGYLDEEKFLQFLNHDAAAGTASADASPLASLGPVALLAAILLGGLALNLTPCVLPMIPINLAIIGAGSQGSSRQRGFALGLTYGMGMALAYGILGLAVVLTGSKFGTLNSSPWFNLAMAAIFVLLGLAMFDKLVIDLSRFQKQNGSKSQKGAFLAAASMGSVSALLAGACVAPVVISVLLMGTKLYQNGNAFGLVLPFVLGVGMALPWPFAGAGLSFLPKPGMWMNRVKYAFGIFIFAFAAYYGYLGTTLLLPAGNLASNHKSPNAQAPHQILATAIQESRSTGKPILVDCWASWCKNCSAMEHTTFQDPKVQERLQDFVFVKLQAERLNDPSVKGILDQLGVMGLPTYVLLSPDNQEINVATLPTPKSQNH